MLLLLFLNFTALHLPAWPKWPKIDLGVLRWRRRQQHGRGTLAPLPRRVLLSASAWWLLVPEPWKKQRGLSDEGDLYLGMARPGWKVNFRLTGWAAGSPKNPRGGREEAACGCDPSSGASSGPRCLPEAMRSTATPCMRKVSLFQLIIGMPTHRLSKAYKCKAWRVFYYRSNCCVF